jgi:anaphase-promoting complex subunit 2
MIISRHFWPALDSSALIMPGQFKTCGHLMPINLIKYSLLPALNHSLQEGYAREFTKFKPDKKLQWLSHLGTVQLDVELEDRTVSAEVPPLEAALIELFSERRG